MNKITIRDIAMECFLAGKENMADKDFEEFFEKVWRYKR